MSTIQLIACIGMIAGFFILLNLSPMEFTGSVFARLTDKPKSLREEINETTRRKKKFYLRRELDEVQAILKVTGRSARFPMLCAAALLCFAVGASVAVMLGNFFLVPVMAAGCLFLPFWWVKLTASHFKKDIAAELETALSIITTAYLRNEDILTAVEENVAYLNQPVLNVFRGFVSRIKLVNPDVTAALHDLKGQIDNAVFREWCDALIA
jgi:Flp pilus assembly protein TadB